MNIDYDYEFKLILTVSNNNFNILNPVIYSGSFNTLPHTLVEVKKNMLLVMNK